MSGLSVLSYFKPSLVSTCPGRLLYSMGRKNSKLFMLLTSFLIIILLLSVPLFTWAGKPPEIELAPNKAKGLQV